MQMDCIKLKTLKFIRLTVNLFMKNNFKGHSKKEIDLSNQTKGLYFVEIILGNKNKVIRKLIVK